MRRRHLFVGLATLALSLLLPIHLLLDLAASISSPSLQGSRPPSAFASTLHDEADEPAGEEEAAPEEDRGEGVAEETEDVQTAEDAADEEQVADAEDVSGGDVPDEGAAGSRVTPSSRGGSRPASSVRSLADRLVAIAREQLGARYRWGGTSPSGFDCSGFTMFVYSQAGIRLPRDLHGQMNSGRILSIDELQPGDLVFFKNTFSWGLSHSGIYIGDNQFINAENEWTGVVASPLRGSNWERNFAGGSRPYEK